MGTGLHSIDTSVNGNSGIVHVASDVAEDLKAAIVRQLVSRRRFEGAVQAYLGLQAQLADGCAIIAGLGGSGRRGNLNLVVGLG